MDYCDDIGNVVTFTSWLLAFLVHAHNLVYLPAITRAVHANEDAPVVLLNNDPIFYLTSVIDNALNCYRLTLCSYALPEEVRFWVKPRSTTWFSRFLVEQYDNGRWISMFRMTKEAVLQLTDLLAPHVQKKNTNYRLAVPVLVRVACTLFKLAYGANLNICSEMFAIGRSTVCKILRDVVHAINVTLRHEISWPHAERMRETQAKFLSFYSLPAIVGAIDVVHVAISKSEFGAHDYFYFKTRAYSMSCQTVVDSDKRFLDLYVGMPGSTNDARVLRRSSLYNSASTGNLMDAMYSVAGQTPYLIGDTCYPLLPWLMVPHAGTADLSISKSLFNRKLRKGRCVVENAFGIMKHTFRELLSKTDLHLSFLPDVIICCGILHNLLLQQSHEDVENLLQTLRTEGLPPEILEDGPPRYRHGRSNDEVPDEVAVNKRFVLNHASEGAGR